MPRYKTDSWTIQWHIYGRQTEATFSGQQYTEDPGLDFCNSIIVIIFY